MSTSDLQKTFLAFREQCSWLQICFNTFVELYETGEKRKDILFRSASNFFSDLNYILQQYCYLQICRLTDPPRMAGRENLTIAYLNEMLTVESRLNPQIQKASDAIMRYRNEFIGEPRNRLISHADKKTILSGKPLGGHDRAEDNAFFENLYSYVNEVGEAVGVGPLDFRGTAGPGDVINLIHVLKDGLDWRDHGKHL